jgi:hypothetical protein
LCRALPNPIRAMQQIIEITDAMFCISRKITRARVAEARLIHIGSNIHGAKSTSS